MSASSETKKKWWQKNGKLVLDVYAHGWGFLIPCESGAVYRQQTGGVMCSHVELEGVFYPLVKPEEYDPVKKKSTKLLKLLTDANYIYRNTDKLWERIKERMHFDFEIVEAPEGLPESDEGFLWIKLTKFEGGWGHMDWVEDLVGKTMVLIYPNCD